MLDGDTQSLLTVESKVDVLVVAVLVLRPSPDRSTDGFEFTVLITVHGRKAGLPVNHRGATDCRPAATVTVVLQLKSMSFKFEPVAKSCQYSGLYG